MSRAQRRAEIEKDRAALGQLEHERRKVERAEAAARTQPLISAFEACTNRRKARAAQRKRDAGEQESDESDCILLSHLAHRAYCEQQQSDKEKPPSTPSSGDEPTMESEEAKVAREAQEAAEKARIEQLAAQRKMVEEEREKEEWNLIEDEDGDAIPPVDHKQSHQNPDKTGKWSTAEYKDNSVDEGGYYPSNMDGISARAFLDILAIQSMIAGWPHFRQLKKEEETIIIDDPRGRQCGRGRGRRKGSQPTRRQLQTGDYRRRRWRNRTERP